MLFFHLFIISCAADDQVVIAGADDILNGLGNSNMILIGNIGRDITNDTRGIHFQASCGRIWDISNFFTGL